METTDRTIAAEARFVEEGHHTFLGHDDRGAHVRVVSDTLGHTGKAYKVTALASGPDLPVVFTCRPDGQVRDGHLTHSSVTGATTCKHMAGAARRLEREGLVRFETGAGRDSRWVATEKACPAPVAAPEGDDPFAGFPQF